MSESARNLCKICRLPVEFSFNRARKKLDDEMQSAALSTIMGWTVMDQIAEIDFSRQND